MRGAASAKHIYSTHSSECSAIIDTVRTVWCVLALQLLSEPCGSSAAQGQTTEAGVFLLVLDDN